MWDADANSRQRVRRGGFKHAINADAGRGAHAVTAIGTGERRKHRRHIADATLSMLGGAVTPEDTQAGQNLINGDPTAADLPPAVQTEIINTVAVNRAINRTATVPAPGTDLPSYYREYGGFLVAAAILAKSGLAALDPARLAPTRTARNVRRDVETVKEATNDTRK